MSGVLREENFEKLKKYLPISFQVDFHNLTESIARAYPLLSLMCENQDLLNEIHAVLKVNAPPLLEDPLVKAMELTDKMLVEFRADSRTPFKYRLPLIISEFPIHSRVINKAIEKFNSIIEKYHQQNMDSLNQKDIDKAFKNILQAIKAHGPSCDSDSLWQLLSMMSGWSAQSPEQCFKECPYLLYHCKGNTPLQAQRFSLGAEIKKFFGSPRLKKEKIIAEKEKIIPKVIESNREASPSSNHPFIENGDYDIDRAGRLAHEINTLLLNAFGMKLGGHFDAQTKLAPRFIPIRQLHAIIHRQLSHRIDIPSSIDFDHWIEDSLMSLGMKQILQHEGDRSSEKFVNPFLEEPISFLSPEKIKQTLIKSLPESGALHPGELDLDVISQYLFDLLQSFQFNPGQALGIGANWDGTINLSNESGAYPFKFNESEAEWGRRFKEISLHRQGPSEALMNVMENGLKFELGTIFSDFDYMSQLQPSEYAEVIRSAIIDNLVTDLFPEPAYHENEEYKKYQKQHVVRRDTDGKMHIDSFYQPHKKGTYFGKNDNKKQTPMYRRAGTLDVQAFPRRSTSSESYRESYADNPLVPLQVQYGQSMYQCTRGHIVYDPISADQFLPDPMYGQVLRSDNGDYLPFIGVIPKNYDRNFKQPTELCASFVLRMINSSRLMVHCPTFRETYEQIKSNFLPEIDTTVPALPNITLSEHIKHLHHKLSRALAKPERHYGECEKVFYALFKNIIRSLYELVSNAQDNHVKANFIHFITSFDKSNPSKANLERFIRELIVNKPVSASPQALQNYEITIDYLQKLIRYFYPEPSQSMAAKIADQADAYVKPLLASQGVRQYFENQKKISQANLSRKSTPSSLFSALRDGKIKHIWQHKENMHKKNMPSGYRDPEGNQLTAMQAHEKRMDNIVKTAGAMLQTMKKHDVLFGVSKLISEPVMGARQAYAKHERYKYAWGMLGGVVGFFKGLWKVTSSIPSGLIASGKWIYKKAAKKNKKNEMIVNPLAISAVPGNEPGLKVKLNMQMRDYLLSLLHRRPVNPDKEKEVMMARLINLMSDLYPDMNDEAKKVTSAMIRETFPDVDWGVLLNPFPDLLNDKNLMKHRASINASFIQAVFACLTDNMGAKHTKALVNKYYQYYALSPNQKNALFEFVNHYHRIQDKKAKNEFLYLFRFHGKIHKALHERDEVIQKIQAWNNSIYTMASIMQQMPSDVKAHFREALEKNDLSILDEYQIDNQVLHFLKSYAAANQPCELLEHSEIGKMIDENVLSNKDKAHDKWTSFAQRELRHKLLQKNEIDLIFLNISTKLGKNSELIKKLNELKDIYNDYFLTHVQNESLDIFYEKANGIIKEIEAFQQEKTLLQNFMDITMNAVVNARLDQVNIFEHYINDVKNPLNGSEAIIQWLNTLQAAHQLRALLDQQLEQSPSLDHALWRDKCILQILEKNKNQDRVHKTGLRSLLRIWARHDHNITKTGETYSDPKTREPQKVSSTAVLFDGCRTMQYAVNPGKKAFTFFREVEYKSDHSSFSQAPFYSSYGKGK